MGSVIWMVHKMIDEMVDLDLLMIRETKLMRLVGDLLVIDDKIELEEVFKKITLILRRNEITGTRSKKMRNEMKVELEKGEDVVRKGRVLHVVRKMTGAHLSPNHYQPAKQNKPIVNLVRTRQMSFSLLLCLICLRTWMKIRDRVMEKKDVEI